MLNLTKSIWGMLSGSALSSHIGNRLYKGQAPEGSIYPYAVFFVITDVPDRTFTELFEDITLQFSLFSTTSGTTEIEDIYTDLIALYDECEVSIEEEKLVWMRESNAGFIPEDHTTPTGTQRVWAYHVEFELKVQVTPYAVVWMDTTDVIWKDTDDVAFRAH